ncbi:MAG: DUF2934 domain-containing protein [Gammaproteobacteria bacterium]|nr:DUF2934 domain-containing protein [Gammaproteobacteria bacterium]
MRKDTMDSAIDPERYDAARTPLQNAFEHMLAAGHSVRDFSEFALEKFGDSFLPYLRRFLADVEQGRIRIEGIGRTAKTVLLGVWVTPEERIEMIRLAAFVRAEQRGFRDGSPEDDWLAAEREVDARLAQEAGLATRGHKAFATATAALEQEFGNLKTTIADWLEKAAAPMDKPRKQPARKKSEATVS